MNEKHFEKQPQPHSNTLIAITKTLGVGEPKFKSPIFKPSKRTEE